MLPEFIGYFYRGLIGKYRLIMGLAPPFQKVDRFLVTANFGLKIKKLNNFYAIKTKV